MGHRTRFLGLLALASVCYGQAAIASAQTEVPAPDSITIVPTRNGADAQDLWRTIVERVRQGGDLPVQSPPSLTTNDSSHFVSLGGDHPFTAVAISNRRLEQLAADILRRVSTERASAPSALDELRQQVWIQGRSSLRANSYALANLQAGDTAQPRDLRVNETFAMVIERARLTGFRVDAGQLQLLPASAHLEALATRHPRLNLIAARYRETIGALGNLLRDPNPTSRDRALVASRNTFEAFVEAWPSLRGNWEERRAAVRALDGLARQSELKAIYGVRSDFLPASYQAIFLQSARTATIYDNQGRAICSGLALTSEWILTAGHCFGNRPWQTTSVGLSIVAGQTERYPTKDLWPNPPPGSVSNDAIDYALVRIQAPPQLASDFAAFEQRTAAAGVRPLCLRSRPGAYEEPIVVIAQIEGDRRVYDHAYIWYPYELYEPDYLRVSAMTGLRLHRFAEATWPESRADQEEFLQENFQYFESAYSSFVGTGSQRRRVYRWMPGSSSRMPSDPALRRPMFGFDTDTTHGNSGGAVFSRSDACILGVFAGGRPDGVWISENSWREHEFATPINAILADVEQRLQSDSGETAREVAALMSVLRASLQ